MLAKIVSQLNKVVSRRLAIPDFDSHIAQTAFYLIFLGSFSKDWHRLIATGVKATDWYGALKIFSFISPEILTFDGTYLLTVLSFLAAAFFPKIRTFRVLAFVFLILLFNVIFTSTGKVNHHSFHVGFFISFALIFFDYRYPLKNKIVLLACQYTLLAHYTMSGFWKLRGAFLTLSPEHSVAKFDQIFLYHLAYSVAEQGMVTPLAKFITQNDWLGGPIWFAVIVIEFFAFVTLFSEFAFRHWWKMIFLVHFGAGITMGIWFTTANNLFVYLFLLVPHLAYRQKRSEELCAR